MPSRVGFAHSASAASSVQPPANHGETTQEHALRFAEQPVAPVDGRAQRALPRRRGANRRGSAARDDRPAARRCWGARARQPVLPPARLPTGFRPDAGRSAASLGRCARPPPSRVGARGPDPTRGLSRRSGAEFRAVGTGVSSGTSRGGTDQALLAGNPQRFPARCQDLQPTAVAQQPAG